MTAFARSRVTAVLGPTNTGKTFLAIDRMLGHASGMIGFPLRLLARENYDRVVKLKGARQVALVTGEEKIVPPGARYFLCTVESMPVDRPVAFLGVDEIQLCADPERGHVFTDRLLHARGTEETMFMGADTIRPILDKLVPEAETITRPRFSTLTYTGARKVTRLPPRSSVVAFSAAEVYAMAELMRRQRGGTAVVLGALSPRTRNAQVGMFEAGEVDYLVATDAIGMGLNLNLDHVAFAKLAKFDGQAIRRLSPAEIAQIAGRAGRHMTDGTFGTTNDAGAIDPEVVEAVEGHRFDPLRSIYWRNRDLDFRSPGLLLKSLDRRPPSPLLVRPRRTDDLLALSSLARDPEVAARASNPGAVRLLWEVCQIPDFQKILSDQHARLLGRVFGHLMDGHGRLPEDWVARQIARIDRDDGDIDTLVARIAHIRTWTYIANRADWLADAQHWQERTRIIEDKLSDALHDRLTARFVDRRAAMLVRRLRAGDDLLAAVKADGTVLVEGEYVGRLEGFRFRVDPAVGGEDARALLTAARRALLGEIPARLRRLERDRDNAFDLLPDGLLTWREVPVGRLAAGDSALNPAVEPLPSEFLDGRSRERLRARLAAWVERHLRRRLMPLYRVAEAAASDAVSGPARGLLYQLGESLGLVPRAVVAEQVRGLGKSDRKVLAGLGVRLGRDCVFLPSLNRPARTWLRALLWSVHRRAPVPALPDAGALAFVPGNGAEGADGFCRAIGFRRLTGRDGAVVAVRAEAIERLGHQAQRLGKNGPFPATPALARLVGGDEAVLEAAMRALRYGVRCDNGVLSFVPRGGRRTAGETASNGAQPKQPRKTSRTDRPRKMAGRADSPFAKLRELTPGE